VIAAVRSRAALRAAVTLLAFAAILTPGAWAQKPAQPVPYDPFAPSSTGLRQIAEIMNRISRSMGDIPPDVERIAIYQIKTDSKQFDPGTNRYIQAQIEETFRKDGRRTVVSSPELRTFRVVSTDSTFRFTNTVLSLDELWKLGEKLHVDAFIEGSCSKSRDGDVILNLKLFRHKTGDIVWSGSFVAGPNEKKPEILDLDYSVSSSLRLFPIKSAQIPTGNDDSLGNALFDTLSGLRMSQYALEFTVSEAVTSDKWLVFSVTGGYGFATSSGGPDSLGVNLKLQTLKFGIEMLGVFFRKPNPDLGYWLGTYVGYQEYIPFFWRGHLSAVSVGYRSRVSRHFTLGGGLMFLVLNHDMKNTLGDLKDSFLTYEPVSYELTFLHYTF
jgi:hypothetical protein